MGKRGPAPLEECSHGHDLTAEGAVKVVITAKGYEERRCVECTRRTAREWWRRNRAKS